MFFWVFFTGEASPTKLPGLGWSYHAGLLRDVSKISAARLLVAASQETTYQELCNESWTIGAGTADFCNESFP